MNNFKDSILYIVSIMIVVLILLLTMFFEKGFAFQIYGPEDIFKIVFSYILLGLLTFQILKGFFVSDKSRMLRNIGIMLIGNVMIYSIMFFTNPNTQIEYFFHQNAINYFIGYFLFSLSASFVGSSFFYEYKKEIETNGFHAYIIWRYFIQSFFSILALYAVFCLFVNRLFPNEIFYNNGMNYVLVGIITAIFLSIFYFLEKKRNSFEKELIQQSTKAETATANFETLKNQLDPHFLFNSLNVLTGLIEENPEKAVDFTTSLSKIYRYLLEQKDKEIVPLEEEIKFAKTYINLLKLRFENSIHFHLNLIDFQEEEYIVPLSLQILLENTIKHNIVSESKPLRIRIYKDNQYLIVENSYQPKDSLKDSTGVGLNNIKNRYQLISNQEVFITNENDLYKVKLPILKTKMMQTNNLNMKDEYVYDQAMKRAIALRKFYKTLINSAVGFGVCAIVNIATFNGSWWCLWVLLVVGINCVAKATKLYQLDENWEIRKTHEILEKNNQSNTKH